MIERSSEPGPGGKEGRDGAAAPPLRASDAPILVPYYLGTPVFAVFDLWLALPVRATGLESPTARLGYYAGAFALGWVMRARPALAPWLAMAESAGNLTLLMAAVLVPIWSLPETMDASLATDLPARVINLAISGSVLVYSFHRASHRASHGARRRVR